MRQAGLFSGAVHSEVGLAELCERGEALDRAVAAMGRALAEHAEGDTFAAGVEAAAIHTYEICGTCGKAKGRSVCPDCLDCELWWKENHPPEDV